MGNLRTYLIGLALTAGPAVGAADVEGYLYSRAGVAAFLDEAAPSPAPSGKCETCNGTGRVGDGRVFTDCLDCGGDGVTSVGVCVCEDCQCENCECGQPVSNEVMVSYDTVCEGGVCRLVPRVADGAVVELLAPVAGSLGSEVRDERVGPVRRVIRRFRENRPVRSFLFCR